VCQFRCEKDQARYRLRRRALNRGLNRRDARGAPPRACRFAQGRCLAEARPRCGCGTRCGVRMAGEQQNRPSAGRSAGLTARCKLGEQLRMGQADGTRCPSCSGTDCSCSEARHLGRGPPKKQGEATRPAACRRSRRRRLGTSGAHAPRAQEQRVHHHAAALGVTRACLERAAAGA
jgi:hypothetical protein